MQELRWQEASARFQAQRDAALSIRDATQREKALWDIGGQYAAQKQRIVLEDRATTAETGEYVAVLHVVLAVRAVCLPL